MAPLAATAADRISRSAILVAGVLCGALVFFVAIPLALSNPFPTLKEAEWVVHRSSLHIKVPISEMVEAQALFDPVSSMPSPQAALWEFVALPAHGSLAFQPPEVTGAEETGSIGESAPPVRQARSIMDEVDEYLWEVYRRAPTKRDSTGDFTWKDPAAAKRLSMSMPTYVIGGMDPDFREQLYHAGRAMDAAGIRWALLSAFRDDYRQSLASGFKAGASNSLHGGKARVGGYGHGQAVDVTSEDGHSDSAVWRWLDRYGAKYGLRRPMPGADPAHIQPGGNWHRTAIALRDTRVGTMLAETKTEARTKVVRPFISA